MNEDQKYSSIALDHNISPDKTLPSPSENYRIIPLDEYQQFKDDQEAVRQLRKSLMAQLTSDEELIEALRTQISSLKWQLQESANQSSVTDEAAWRERQKIFEIKEQELATSQAALEAREQSLAAQEDALKAQKASVEELLKLRDAAHEARNADLEKQEERLKALTEAAELARRKYESAAIESAEYFECLKDKQREVDAMTLQNVELGRQLAELTQTMDETQRELAEAHQQLVSARAEITAANKDARQQIEAAEAAALTQVAAAREAAQAEIASVQAELEKCRQQCLADKEEAEKQLNAKQATVDKLFVKIEELEAKTDKTLVLKKMAERESNFEVTKRNLTERLARLKENLAETERQLKEEKSLRLSESRTTTTVESPDPSNSELKKLLREYLVSIKHSATPAEQAFLPALCALSDMPLADTKRVLSGVVPLPRI